MTCEKVYRELYLYKYISHIEKYGAKRASVEANMFAIKNTWKTFLILNQNL